MKKVLYLIFLNLLVIVLVACASSDTDQESATPEPIPQQVEINVERMGNLITGIGKVKVYIDDEEVTLYLMNPKAPCFIKDDKEDYIYLILPVNFNAGV